MDMAMGQIPRSTERISSYVREIRLKVGGYSESYEHNVIFLKHILSV